MGQHWSVWTLVDEAVCIYWGIDEGWVQMCDGGVSNLDCVPSPRFYPTVHRYFSYI